MRDIDELIQERRETSRLWKLNNPEKVKEHNQYYNNKFREERRARRLKEMELQGEEWLPLAGFEELFIINRLGEVRDAKTLFLKKGRLGNLGYYIITLKYRTYFIHRLLAETFIPNPSPETHKQVIHLNGDRLDNRIENLQWNSRSETMKKNLANGKYKSNLTGWTKKKSNNAESA